jgi:hypothetical protein
MTSKPYGSGKGSRSYRQALAELRAGTIRPESNPLSQAIAQETEAQKKEYLKKLVEIKIQFTRVDRLSSQASISSDATKFISTFT